MLGISSSGKESIGLAIERMFDLLAYKLLGNIPKLKNKSPFFSSTPLQSLAHIFITALGSKEPNLIEKDVLKSILNSSYGYIESLKNKTSSNVMETVDALIKESKIKGEKVTPIQITEILAKEMEKAKAGLKLIAEAETSKTRNMGHTMEILSSAKEQGISDPTIFFVVRRATACEECIKLHMLENRIIPRTWKMSELKMGWHKRGENHPSACGEHPNCQCCLQQLPLGWGFNANGFVTYISPTHDEYKFQRGLE